MLKAIESERGVIGVAAIFGELAHEVSNAIDIEMICDQNARMVLASIKQLIQQSATIDTASLTQNLRENGNLEIIGGQEGFARLYHEAIPRENIGFHMAKIRSAYFARKIVDQSKRISQDPENFDLIMGIQRLAVARDSEGSDMIFDMARDLPVYMDYIDNAKVKQRVFDTGFHNLDSIIGGCRIGDMTTISGRPGGGKTAFLTRMAMNLAELGIRVLMFSTEMGRFQVVDRIMPSLSKVFAYKFRRRDLNEKDYKAVSDASGRVHGKIFLSLHDKPRPGMADFYRAAARVKPEVVMIDYLQRCQRPKAENVTRATDEFMTQLKTFCLEAKVWTILGCQMNRAVDRLGKPTLSDLRDSGAIESESDQVILLHSPDEKDAKTDPKITAIVEKNRHGRTGWSYFVLDRDFAEIREVEDAGTEADGGGSKAITKGESVWPKRMPAGRATSRSLKNSDEQNPGNVSTDSRESPSVTGKEAVSGENIEEVSF